MRLFVLLVCLFLPRILSGQGSAKATGSLGAIAGQVLSEPSETPLSKTVISLFPEEGIVLSPGRSSETTPSTVTDGNGHFRIDGIFPGDYRVNLQRNGFVPETRRSSRSSSTLVSLAAGQEISGLVFRMQVQGVVTGKITDEDGDGVSGATVMVKSRWTKAIYGNGITNDLGEYRIAGLRRGDYLVLAQASSLRITPLARVAKTRAYGPTYYPGTLELNQAAMVHIGPGDAANVSFGLISSPVFRILGTVSAALLSQKETGASHSPAYLLVEPVGDTSGGFQSGSIQPDGAFEISGLLPGSYRVVIQSRSASIPAEQIVDIRDADIDGLQLGPALVGEVRGQFHRDDGQRMDWSQYSFYVEPEDEEVSSGMLGSQVSKDGSFDIKNVPAGNYHAIVSTLAPSLADYFVKNLTVDGKSDADWAVPVTAGTRVIEVVDSAHGATIEGLVTDEADHPVSEAQVVCITETPMRKPRDGYQQVMSDQRGHFRLRGLVPGEYTVFALDDYVEGITDPEFVRQHKGSGQTVKVGEGEGQSIVLKIVNSSE